MSSSPSAKHAVWTKRIARAGELAERNPWAKQVLNFYGHVLQFQQSLYGNIDITSAKQPTEDFRQQIDVDGVAGNFPALLALVEREGPPQLAQQASRLREASPKQLGEILRNWLRESNHPADGGSFFARVLLQPYAERFAEHDGTPAPQVAGNKCPRCQSDPQLAVIRPEGDGGKRSLLCSFCQTEWEFRRILCPACGEENHEKLPRYSAEGIVAVRVEACDTCHTYLKSVDMTVDGLAVPVVDEIATAPLDLWAAEHSYAKLQLNILGF